MREHLTLSTQILERPVCKSQHQRLIQNAQTAPLAALAMAPDRRGWTNFVETVYPKNGNPLDKGALVLYSVHKSVLVLYIVLYRRTLHIVVQRPYTHYA